MTTGADILRLRLRAQLIDRAAERTDAAAVVRRLTALQAQDYAGSLWSVGLRCAPEAAASDVERAIAERRIVRTWPMRGTLHLVAAEDVRWMLALLAPRATAKTAGRHAQLGLGPAEFERARALFADALAGGRLLTRPEMMAVLEDGGVSTTGQRGYHVLVKLAQEAVLCLGPMRGSRQTFALLEDWVPPSREAALPRREGLARLAARYFRGHGPASVADFAWWAGLTKADARTGIDEVSERFERLDAGGTTYWASAEADAVQARGAPSVHLLPGFDEYMLGYTGRALQLAEHGETYGATVSSNGVFSPTLVIGGRIAGIWRRAVRRGRVEISVREFRRLTARERAGLERAADRYGRFLGTEAVIL